MGGTNDGAGCNGVDFPLRPAQIRASQPAASPIAACQLAGPSVVELLFLVVGRHLEEAQGSRDGVTSLSGARHPEAATEAGE